MTRSRVSLTQRLVLAALLTALTAVCAQVQIPLPTIPISLALLGVYLCGALLGARWGVLSVTAYVLLGAIGVPVYAGFVSGPAILFGPTGGYIFGYILCAAIIGMLSHHLGFTMSGLCLSMALGTVACYALGTLWFMFTNGTNLWASLSACVLPFLPGDALKVVLAAMLALRIRKPLRAMDIIN